MKGFIITEEIKDLSVAHYLIKCITEEVLNIFKSKAIDKYLQRQLGIIEVAELIQTANDTFYVMANI